jgi:hypothetical protein
MSVETFEVVEDTLRESTTYGRARNPFTQALLDGRTVWVAGEDGHVKFAAYYEVAAKFGKKLKTRKIQREIDGKQVIGSIGWFYDPKSDPKSEEKNGNSDS